MDFAAPPQSTRSTRLAGYLFALHNLEYNSRNFLGRGCRFEESVLDPFDHVPRDRFVIGRHLIETLLEHDMDAIHV